MPLLTDRESSMLLVTRDPILLFTTAVLVIEVDAEKGLGILDHPLPIPIFG